MPNSQIRFFSKSEAAETPFFKNGYKKNKLSADYYRQRGRTTDIIPYLNTGIVFDVECIA